MAEGVSRTGEKAGTTVDFSKTFNCAFKEGFHSILKNGHCYFPNKCASGFGSLCTAHHRSSKELQS